ncbi:hypothetical protein JIQ42_07627 [Leishmania sp. Namibia]|uniref:hypothetical protein n=1 Tax=Leishmania sp. Namibia TaxID=2802991 RepID=UPI001B7516D7|nr:hypothetical protein JIQ42_07627 [Leishmania sp. Namibia]
MPPRSRPSAQRRRRSSGTGVDRIRGSPIAAAGTVGSQAGAAAKRRRANSPPNGVSTGSDCSGNKRTSGTLNSLATTATPPRLGTPTTRARATAVPNTHDRETDEDEADTLQRFSNVSAWQHAREMPPPNPAPTPPPSPPCTPADAGEAGQAAHISSSQRGVRDALSMERSPVCKQPVYGSHDTVGPPTPTSPSASSPSARTFSAALLSQLLLAEAACAEAAATAAQQHGGDTFGDGSDATAGPCYAPPQPQPLQLAAPVTAAATTEWCRYRRESDMASLPEQRQEATFSVAASQSLLPMESLTVCIGVVPLPGSEATFESTTGRKTSRWWPWSRTASTVKSDAAAGVVSEAASDETNHNAKGRGSGTEVKWLAPLRDQTVSVRQLRPRRFDTSRRQHTDAAVSGRFTSATSTQRSGARANELANNGTPIGHTFHSGPAADLVGWTGVFADVPLVLPGAQLAGRPDEVGVAINASREAHARGGVVNGCLQSEPLVCSAAASISVLLA